MSVVGIDHSKKVLAELGEMAVDLVDVAKHGKSLKVIWDLFEKGKDLMKEASKSLPEVKDLQADEAKELVELAYKVVKDVVAAITK